MLKKETFVSVIKEIEAQEKINESVTTALNPICEGNGFFYDGGCLYRKALLKVLKEAMHDKHDNIEWWLYEYDRPSEILVDGVKRSIETAEDLYDYIAELQLKKNS